MTGAMPFWFPPQPPQPSGLVVTAFSIAERFVGIKEVPGGKDNPAILAMLRLDVKWPKNDETPWCSAFLSYVCWLLRLPRSKSLRARSWLLVGRAVPLIEACVGFDAVILKRGRGHQPGPNVIDAPGHVALYGGRNEKKIALLGGNQGDMVSLREYPENRVIGVRRLHDVRSGTPSISVGAGT